MLFRSAAAYYERNVTGLGERFGGVVQNYYNLATGYHAAVAPEIEVNLVLAANEQYAIAAREQAKADLQTALDKAKTATATADALAQKCGGQPITVRIPGYSETFWDISS